jgi:hypothetical protein
MMKNLLSIIVLLIMMAPVQSAWANINEYVEESIIIPAGTVIELDLSTPVHSKRNKIGDMLILKVREDVVIGGIPVIQKNAKGLAFVTDIKRAGPWGKGGGVRLKADCTWSLNDIKVPMAFNFEQKGEEHKMLAPVLLFGLCAGYITGDNVSIPPGTKFTAKVVEDTNLHVSPRELNEIYEKKVNNTPN